MTRAIEDPFASLERTRQWHVGQKRGGREKQFREKFREIVWREGKEEENLGNFGIVGWIIIWNKLKINLSARNNILNGLLFNREFLLHEENLAGHGSNSNVMEVTGKLFSLRRDRERRDKTTAWILYEFRVYMILWNHWNGSYYHYAFIYKIVCRFAHKFTPHLLYPLIFIPY